MPGARLPDFAYSRLELQTIAAKVYDVNVAELLWMCHTFGWHFIAQGRATLAAMQRAETIKGGKTVHS